MPPTEKNAGWNKAQRRWNLLASKSRRNRRIKDASLFAFLIAASIPIIIPYFWLLTLAFSAGRTGVDTRVLWPSIFISCTGRCIDLDLGDGRRHEEAGDDRLGRNLVGNDHNLRDIYRSQPPPVQFPVLVQFGFQRGVP